MERYGIIVTEKADRDDHIIHWLRRGTVVRVLAGGSEIECVSSCLPVPAAIRQMGHRIHRQFINADDVLEIEPDQLAALREGA